MSIFQRFINFFSPTSELRGILFGLDASGKTTFLYKLKLLEAINAIPTIGFNVEEVSPLSSNTKITLWDVGGCDKIRPLWRHYFNNTHFIIFFIGDFDINLRLDEAKSLFVDSMNEENIQDAPIAIVFNRYDIMLKSKSMKYSVEEVESIIRREWLTELKHPNRPIQFFRTCVCPDPKDRAEFAEYEQNVFKVIEWIDLVCTKGIKDSSKNFAKDAPKSIMDEWLEHEDEADDLFLEKLKTYQLDSWDHRTHLRIAWLLLVRHGRQKGKDLIFQYIQEYIKHSSRTNGKTFHETMTYFWTHMVHYAIVSSSTKLGLETRNDMEQKGLCLSEFKWFLFMNPQLSNGGLFLDYYSKDLILMNPEARATVVLPDKKPLPSILPVANESQNNLNSMSNPTHVFAFASIEDHEFLRQWNTHTLKSWGHMDKMRLLYILLLVFGRRGGASNLVQYLLSLQERTYSHFTINYFWMHYLSLLIGNVVKRNPNLSFYNFFQNDAVVEYIRDYQLEELVKKDIHAEPFIDPSKPFLVIPNESVPFKDFLERYLIKTERDQLEDSLLYNKYYSRNLIEKSSSKESFELPDLSPLPN